MSPDQDILDLLAEGQSELGFDLLWQRYRVPCVRFLTQRFPAAPDDEIASAVTDGFLQLYDSDKKWSLGASDHPLYHQLFFFANRRLIDAYRKRTAQRRGGNMEWLLLEESGEMAADHHRPLTDELVINEVRHRLTLPPPSVSPRCSAPLTLRENSPAAPTRSSRCAPYPPASRR